MIDDVLRLFRLHAEVYHNAKVCGDWTITEHFLGQTCFHMPTEGSCVLNVPEHVDVVLEEGELVIFPREIPHTMTPTDDLVGAQAHVPFEAMEPGTGMLCGKIEFMHAGGGAFIDALPACIVLKHSESTAWLQQLLALMIEESYRDASSLVMDRLTEMVFVYAIRHYIEHEHRQAGMLALYGAVKLKNALRAMHAEPEKSWSLDELAHVCGLSRTGFANAFRDISGWTTMQYLTWWRMQLAYSKLMKGETVSQVAPAVGYKSDAAFSRAFQKEFCESAGKVRRRKI